MFFKFSVKLNFLCHKVHCFSIVTFPVICFCKYYSAVANADQHLHCKHLGKYLCAIQKSPEVQSSLTALVRCVLYCTFFF